MIDLNERIRILAERIYKASIVSMSTIETTEQANAMANTSIVFATIFYQQWETHSSNE